MSFFIRPSPPLREVQVLVQRRGRGVVQETATWDSPVECSRLTSQVENLRVRGTVHVEEVSDPEPEEDSDSESSSDESETKPAKKSAKKATRRSRKKKSS